MKKRFANVALFALFGPLALGQHGVGISGGRGPSPAGGNRAGMHGIVVVERGHHRPFARRPFFGYTYPYFYPDDYGPEEVEYVQEPAPQPAPPVQEKPEPLPDPVLLELHGNQWVKVSNFSEASPDQVQPVTQGIPPKEMLPAVLVYRDGRSEEVNSYSIIGKVIYTKADYYASGSWTRTIQLADLDLPATVKQNEQRGVKFDLPSGPDEVVIRP